MCCICIAHVDYPSFVGYASNRGTTTTDLIHIEETSYKEKYIKQESKNST